MIWTYCTYLSVLTSYNLPQVWPNLTTGWILLFIILATNPPCSVVYSSPLSTAKPSGPIISPSNARSAPFRRVFNASFPSRAGGSETVKDVYLKSGGRFGIRGNSAIPTISKRTGFKMDMNNFTCKKNGVRLRNSFDGSSCMRAVSHRFDPRTARTINNFMIGIYL